MLVDLGAVDQSIIRIDRPFHHTRSNARDSRGLSKPNRCFSRNSSLLWVASAMRLTTIAAHVPVMTLLCAPRLQYVSSFVLGSRTKFHPNKCTLIRCTKDLLIVGSRTVDEYVRGGLNVGCWARSTTRRPATGTRTALYGRGTIDDDDNNETLGSKDRDDEETMTSDTSSSRDVPNKVKAPSVTRIGGRSSSPLPARTNGGIGGIFSVESVQKFVLPVVLLLLLLKALLGGVFFSPPPTRSSFVYYQSSTYESRTVDGSGNVKTIRKESVRSNMPLDGWQQQMDGIGRRYIYVDESESSNKAGSRFGQDTQREIDSEVAESMTQVRDMIRGMGFADLSSLDYR